MSRSKTPPVLLRSVSPLPISLATTLGISFDFFSSGYLDVSVPRVPHVNLWIHFTLQGSSPCGFPHSDIRGSMLIYSSPRLFAVSHVLRRLLMPRHSPYALLRLNFSALCCCSLWIVWVSYKHIGWKDHTSVRSSFLHLSVKLFLYPIWKDLKFRRSLDLLFNVLFICSFSLFLPYSIFNEHKLRPLSQTVLSILTRFRGTKPINCLMSFWIVYNPKLLICVSK